MHELPPSWRDSWGLPSSAYTDPATYVAEEERIWLKEWTFLAHVNELRDPGQYACGNIGPHSVFGVRGSDGILRGFYNVCPHRGSRIVAGCGQTNRLQCPYHSWVFELDGQLRTACGMEKKPDFDSRVALSEIAVDVVAGLVFVNADTAAEPLSQRAPQVAEFFDEALPSLRDFSLVDEHSYEVECNWKLMADNSLECGHCPTIHPNFVKEFVEPNRYDIWTDESGDFSTATANLRPEMAKRFGGPLFQYYRVWPAVEGRTIGAPNNLLVRQSISLGPSRTRFRCRVYFESKEAYEGSIHQESLRTNFDEDSELLEALQRQMSSPGFKRGRFMNDDTRFFDERAVQHFQARVATQLGIPLYFGPQSRPATRRAAARSPN